MRKLTLLVVILAFTTGQHLWAQRWGQGMDGEGPVIKQEISLAGIDGFDLGIGGDVILTPGPTQKIVIEGQQNIIDNIKRDVSNGTWRIAYIKNVDEVKSLTIYITVPTIKYVGLSGSGSIASTGKFSSLKDVDIAVAGSGEISLDIEARETGVRLSGSGDIELAGSTESLEVAISGSGDVMTRELMASRCKVQISGSGDAAVYVNGDLETAISGSGDVTYKGDASVTARISGSGEVRKF
jgi:hypothetical protein